MIYPILTCIDWSHFDNLQYTPVIYAHNIFLDNKSSVVAAAVSCVSSVAASGEDVTSHELSDEDVVRELVASDLVEGFPVLTLIDGLFYAGHVTEIQPPDIYGVLLDGGRRSRPSIHSREDLLQNAVSLVSLNTKLNWK